jgi:hypothetical protein
VADTNSGKAPARAGVQAQAAGPRGRTRRFSAPPSDHRPSREAATFGIGALAVLISNPCPDRVGDRCPRLPVFSCEQEGGPTEKRASVS